MDTSETYDKYKLFKYELLDLNNTLKKKIENHFKYFRCIHNLCLLNYLNSNLFIATEPFPKN